MNDFDLKKQLESILPKIGRDISGKPVRNLLLGHKRIYGEVETDSGWRKRQWTEHGYSLTGKPDDDLFFDAQKHKPETPLDMLTVRDHFMMAALTGLIARESRDETDDSEKEIKWVCKLAYQYADLALQIRDEINGEKENTDE